MNKNWHVFLDSLPLSLLTNAENVLYAISDFSILKVSGIDAATFLQGQITCNINELLQNNSFFAGLCNPKGRVISTFLIVKHDDEFLLLLPRVLFEKVKNTLQKYILRAKVQLHDASDDLCLSGLACSQDTAHHLNLPLLNFSYEQHWLKLPTSHYLLIANATNSINRWTALLKQGFQVQDAIKWSYINVNAGLAWLDNESSEEYIPQMLNLDKLGGISLTKGCYTGQEIVARTHYLGQAKREMFLAHAEGTLVFSTNPPKILDHTGQIVGSVLTAQQDDNHCRMLIIMQTSATQSSELKLDNLAQNTVRLLSN